MLTIMMLSRAAATLFPFPHLIIIFNENSTLSSNSILLLVVLVVVVVIVVVYICCTSHHTTYTLKTVTLNQFPMLVITLVSLTIHFVLRPCLPKEGWIVQCWVSFLLLSSIGSFLLTVSPFFCFSAVRRAPLDVVSPLAPSFLPLPSSFFDPSFSARGT